MTSTTADSAATQWLLARDSDTLGRSYAIGFNSGALGFQCNGSNLITGGMNHQTATPTYVVVTGSAATNAWTLYQFDLSSVPRAPIATTWTQPATTTGSTTIGARTYAGNQSYCQVTLDSISIWNRAMTKAEAAALFREEVTGYPTTLNRFANLSFLGSSQVFAPYFYQLLQGAG